jgi:hypothetical protein
MIKLGAQQLHEAQNIRIAWHDNDSPGNAGRHLDARLAAFQRTSRLTQVRR